MNTLDPWFVTGFIEGEGAFTYSLNGGSMIIIFSVRQRHDYSDIVNRLHEFFGVGTVYAHRGYGKSQATSYYRVNRWNELPVVIRHFEKFPLRGSRKRAAFEAWKRLISVKGWRGSSGNKKDMIAAAKELSSLNTRPRGFTTRKLNP